MLPWLISVYLHFHTHKSLHSWNFLSRSYGENTWVKQQASRTQIEVRNMAPPFEVLSAVDISLAADTDVWWLASWPHITKAGRKGTGEEIIIKNSKSLTKAALELASWTWLTTALWEFQTG